MVGVENTDVAATKMRPAAKENGRPGGLDPKSSYSVRQGHVPALHPCEMGVPPDAWSRDLLSF